MQVKHQHMTNHMTNQNVTEHMTNQQNKSIKKFKIKVLCQRKGNGGRAGTSYPL